MCLESCRSLKKRGPCLCVVKCINVSPMYMYILHPRHLIASLALHLFFGESKYVLGSPPAVGWLDHVIGGEGRPVTTRSVYLSSTPWCRVAETCDCMV